MVTLHTIADRTRSGEPGARARARAEETADFGGLRPGVARRFALARPEWLAGARAHWLAEGIPPASVDAFAAGSPININGLRLRLESAQIVADRDAKMHEWWTVLGRRGGMDACAYRQQTWEFPDWDREVRRVDALREEWYRYETEGGSGAGRRRAAEPAWVYW